MTIESAADEHCPVSVSVTAAVAPVTSVGGIVGGAAKQIELVIKNKTVKNIFFIISLLMWH
jgi:hypothetical protein